MNLLRRWDVVSKYRQNMWSRISLDYLHLLQARSKWFENSNVLKEENLLNRFVLLKNKNYPSLNWQRGRIEKVIHGSDNIIRVVDVKTPNGIKRRAITEVCPLPMLNEDISIPSPSDHISIVSDNQENNSKSKTIKKQFKTSKNILTSMLCFTLLIPIVLGSNEQFVNVTQFRNHPGLFFDGVGRISIEKDQWHIITYFNLTSYWSNCKQFNSMISILRPLCSSEPCLNSINELQHHVSDITELNVLIKEECHVRELIRSNKIKRSYHAPLDLIGKIAHLAFGTLDSEYAENMEKAISNVKSNEDRLLMMIKNHTTILDKTVNIMKKNNVEIIQKFKELHDGYLVLTAAQKKLEKQTIFNTLVGYLTLILIKYREIQKQIHNSLRDFKKGRLDPILINPYELEQHLKDVDNIIGSSNRLPSKHFAELETITKLAVVHSKNCLIFHIEIPLLRKEHYTLYRMVPVPTLILGKLMYINPSTEYFAISESSSNYYLMSKLEFQKCDQFYDTKICHQEQVIYSLNNDNHCEVNFFLHKMEVSSQCDVRYGSQNQYWFELHQTNTWLYSVTKQQALKVTCGSNVLFSRTLVGEGLVQVHPSCMIDVEGVNLPVRQVKYSTLFLEKISPVLPQFDISQNFTVKNTSNPIVLKLDNMEDISKMLDIQRYEEDQPLKSVEIPSIPEVYHFVSFGLIGCLIMVTSLLIFWKCHRSRNSNVNIELRTSESHNPSPALTSSNFRVPEAISMI